MLSASYLASCSDDIMKIYAQLENDIICSMAKRFSKIGIVSDYAKVQADVLKQIGGLQNDIRTYLTKYDAEAQKEIIRLFNSAMNKATAKDLKYFEAAKRELSGTQKQILETTAERLRSQAIVSANEKTRQAFANGEAIKCFSGLQRLTQTIAATAQGDFVNSVNSVYMKTISGAFDYNTAIRDSIKQLAEKGVHTVEYTDSGKIINRSIESAVRMNVLTGINLSASQQTINNCKDTETDLVEVSAHLGARPSHEEWQGKVYCLSGERDYVDGNGQIQHARNFYEVCRLGEPDGICGINCRHSYYPYYEGMETEYSKGELDEYKERTVKVNGEDVSIYEAEQKLRQCERNIRKYKREVDALEIVGADATLEKEKLKNWQKTANALCKESGIRRDYDREFVGKIKDKPTAIKLGASDNKIKVALQEETQKRYENTIIKVENKINDIEKGLPMDFEKADNGNCNPNWKEGTATDLNCQSSVPAFIARLMGFDVQSKPFNEKNQIMVDLSNSTNIAFIDKTTGKFPEMRKPKISYLPKFKEWCINNFEEGKYYSFGFDYKGYQGGGHVLCLYKNKGNLYLYDPQRNLKINGVILEKELSRIKLQSSEIYKISDCYLNKSVVESIFERGKR